MIAEGFAQAFQLLVSLDPEVRSVLWMTIHVSGTATVCSVVLGAPLGIWLALREFRGKQFFSGVLNFGMGLPPVVIGLFVSLMLWRYGPLGDLGLMYTPTAMIIAQTIIAAPIIAGLSFAAILGINPKLRLQLISLGATHWQASRLLIREARMGLMAAVNNAANAADTSTARAKQNSFSSPCNSSNACWACSMVGASGTAN